MSGKYRYVFRFGHGSKAHEILGPSITHFWNDIYDLFDLSREMFVEKLNGVPFAEAEITRLFNDLAEDMNEDYAEVWLEIQKSGMRLRFIETNILPGISLDEQQTLFEEYQLPENGQTLLSDNECRIIYYPFCDQMVIFVYSRIIEETDEHIEVDAGKIKLLLEKAQIKKPTKLTVVTWNEISSEAKDLAEQSGIEFLDNDKMLHEVNQRNLEMALDDFKLNLENPDKKFTKEKFVVYLNLVKSARSNLTKKDSLEHLSQYFFNGVKGLKVKKTNLRGPSEEVDMILANECLQAPFSTLGTPIAVECRHRRKPADSKALRDFYGKLCSIGLRGGILISLKGITGDSYDAIGVIRDARKAGVSIIVITLEDLNEVTNGKKPIDIISDCFYKYV